MNDKRGQLIGPLKEEAASSAEQGGSTWAEVAGLLDWQLEQWGGRRSCCASALHSTGRREQRELPQALAATGGLCGLSSWVL